MNESEDILQDGERCQAADLEQCPWAEQSGATRVSKLYQELKESLPKLPDMSITRECTECKGKGLRYVCPMDKHRTIPCDHCEWEACKCIAGRETRKAELGDIELKIETTEYTYSGGDYIKGNKTWDLSDKRKKEGWKWFI